MIKINIPAALEKRLRAGERVNEEILALVDAARDAREGKKLGGGLAYRDIVAEFRRLLGPALALPPNPSAGWIVRQVTRAKEIGLDLPSIAGIVAGAKRAYPRGPYELEFLLRAGPRLLAEVLAGEGGYTADGGGARVPTHVRTGRPDDE